MDKDFTMRDVMELADEFAAYMLDDDTLADRDGTGKPCSTAPDIQRYKRNCMTDFRQELFGYMTCNPDYASKFPASEEAISLVIKFFETCPLAGSKAKESWGRTLKWMGLDKYND